MKYVQRSFSGGEISPALYARADQSKYRAGAKRMFNFYPSKTGVARMRNGTQFLAEISDVHLFSFVASDGLAYVITVSKGASAVQTITVLASDGVTVKADIDVTFAPSVVTLTNLRMAQGTDVACFTSGVCNPIILERRSDTDWSARVLDPDDVTGSTVPAPTSGFTLGGSAGALSLSYAVTSVDSLGIESSLSVVTTSAGKAEPSPTTPVTFQWDSVNGAGTYNVYRVIAGVPGFVGVSAQNNWVDFGSTPDFDVSPPYALLTGPLAPHITSTTYSAGPNTEYYLVAAYSADGSYSTTLINTPLSKPPGVGDNVVVTTKHSEGYSGVSIFYSTDAGVTYYFLKDATLNTAGTAWVADMDDDTVTSSQARIGGEIAFNPSIAAYVQQRLAFAFDNRPGVVILSRVGAYQNFTSRTPPRADDAIEFRIADSGSSLIRDIKELNGIGLFTSGGEYLINPDGTALSPTTINVTRQGFSGSSRVPVAAIAQTMLSVEDRSSVVRAIVFDNRSDSYTGVDTTTFASHLFSTLAATKSAAARLPDPMLFVLRENGSVLALSYIREQEVMGWCELALPGGLLVKELIVLPDGISDSVYMRVYNLARDKHYLAKMRLAAPSNASQWAYLDLWKYGTTPPGSTAISGLDHLNGARVWAYTLGGPSTPYAPIGTALVTGGVADFGIEGSFVIGIAFISELETLDIETDDANTISDSKKRLSSITLQVQETGGFRVDGEDVPLRTTEAWNQAISAANGKIEVQVNKSWKDDASVRITGYPALGCNVQAITFNLGVGE